MMSRNVDRLLSELIDNRYTVSALAADGTTLLTRKGNPAGLLSLQLQTNTESKKKNEPSEVSKLIADICINNGLKYYSIVVWSLSGGGCCWNTGNINLDELDKNKIATITVNTEDKPSP